MVRKWRARQRKGWTLWSDGTTFWVNERMAFESWDINEQGEFEQVFDELGCPVVEVTLMSHGMGLCDDKRAAFERFDRWVDDHAKGR